MSCAFCRVAALFLFCGLPSCPLPLTLLLPGSGLALATFGIAHIFSHLQLLWIGEYQVVVSNTLFLFFIKKELLLEFMSVGLQKKKKTPVRPEAFFKPLN